jgi:hypothetical protein
VLHEQSSEPEFRLFMFKKLQLIFLTWRQYIKTARRASKQREKNLCKCNK